jgi:tetratricopeptide (TPR) repeat protein
MRSVRANAPDHIPSLLTLSELFIAERAWPEAIEVLQEIVRRGRDVAPRMTALFALASIYEKVLGDLLEAEKSLRTALGIEPESQRAIRALIHRLAEKQNEPEGTLSAQAKVAAKLEIASLLDRLAHVEKDRTIKSDILLELADVRISVDDMLQAERALVEAVAIAPTHARAFTRLSRFFRSPGVAGRPAAFDGDAYARALGAVITRGQELGTSDARWYAALGHLEVDQLERFAAGAGHLQAAIKLDPAQHEARYELAIALSRLNAHDDAAKAVLSMITPNANAIGAVSDPNAALELLERSLNASRQPEEAIVVSELRSIAGALDEGRHAWLRDRRLPPPDSHGAALDRATLVAQAVPAEGHGVLLDIAAAISGVEGKLLRTDLTDLGISSRDRIGKRSGHPLRALLDRLTRSLGLSDIDIVISPKASRTRVIVQDNLWVVVPQSLVDLPEPTQLATIARALARIALSVPWLEELPPSHIEALLVAAARIALPSFGAEEIDANTLKLASQYEPNLAREISRKQKQALERLVPALTPDGARSRRAPRVEALIRTLARAELRIAYVLTGDVLATIDELRGLDAAFFKATETPSASSMVAVLQHPFAGDVVRFALTPEATALRRRAGSTWAG